MAHRFVTYGFALHFIATCVLANGHAQAQDAPAEATKPTYDKYGSPLDTFRNTRLWTDVPAAQDFVKATRPEPKTLDYAPLTGLEPVRPKARDKANVQAFQVEMERELAINERKGHGAQSTASANGKARKRATKPVVDE